VKELWWDPGSVISQDLIQFKTAGSNKLVILAPKEGFRGVKDSAYIKSYADSILWSLSIVDSDDYGLIVNLTDLGICIYIYIYVYIYIYI
jgi:hypothetical protein